MRLVEWKGGDLPKMETWWCTQCNRFGLAAPGRKPLCPVHGDTMVGRPDDPRRVEANAQPDNPGRRPRSTAVIQDADALLRKTSVLEGVTSTLPIPIIANAEDDDLRIEASNGLLLRGQRPAVSLPEPRHLWSGVLDPAWLNKFGPVLERCEVAVYARCPGSLPNRATEAEIHLLQRFGRPIVLYEG